ncbi:hypothetical protein TCAL_16917 [Tigriopus californicus]|uniref:Integrase catalytic domain-containing protein n=1 Tax=Tigriopus californicus TaxID=6832 RepID=A0A553P6T9_TIGCA|nr:hypothetical protein TCAL_16917 [Tigriopus californicus]
MQQVSACLACQSVRTSLPTEPALVTTADYPIHKLGADIFSFAGHEFVLYIDRFSGYPLVKRLKSNSAAKAMAFLAQICSMFGFPESVRVAGRPQFWGDLKTFCERCAICLETFAPYHPEFNGLAKVTVREVKRLMKKCHKTGENFDEQLLYWHCLPLAAGTSPTQAFLGRSPRTALPALPPSEPDLATFRALRHARTTPKPPHTPTQTGPSRPTSFERTHSRPRLENKALA